MTLECRDWGDARAKIRDALGLTEDQPGVKLYDISEGAGAKQRRGIQSFEELQTACKAEKLLWIYNPETQGRSPPASPGKEKEKGRFQPPVFSLL